MTAKKRSENRANSGHDELLELVRESIQAAATFELPDPVRPQHSLVDDLGFDSLRISVLTLEIEERLGHSVLLNRWVEGVTEPSELTVNSLCTYLEEQEF